MICLIRLLTTVFCLNCAVANIPIHVEENLIQNNIVNCALQIANGNFNLRKMTVVISKDVEEMFVDNFLKRYKGTVVVETKADTAPLGQVVVVVEAFESFAKVLDKLKPDLKGKTLLTSGAKFLIVLLANSNKIDRITEILWSYHATNVIIIASDRQNRVNVYTYFPYKNHLNCQNTEPNLIGVWKENYATKDMYVDKMAKMHGCPLYISTTKLYHQSAEQKNSLQIIKKTMTRLLRDVMNFTPIVSVRDYVSIDSDKARNWSNSLNDVISGVANISTCTIPLGIDGVGLLGYSTPYFRVRLAWLAPPVTPGPVWWRLLSPLNGYLWLILLLVLFLVTSLPFALKLRAVKTFCYPHFRNIDKLHGVAIRVWGVMLGQPIRVAPRRFRDFYIIAIWLWFSFVVRSVYQSVLIGALKTDTLIGDFADLKEATDEGYRIGGRAGILSHFEHDPIIKECFEVIPEDKFEEIFHNILEKREHFVLATSLEYAWAYCLAQGKNDNECGHVLPDSIMRVPLVVWTKIHSPFLKPLSVWLPRLIESGLMERDTIKKPSCCLKTATDPTPLTRHQTLSCFICLLLGYTTSMVVFTLEILKYKANKLKKHFAFKT